MTYERAMHLANEAMGIYPAGTIIEGVTKKRTEWQDGWNAYATKLLEKTRTVLTWFKALPEDSRLLIEQCLKSEKLSLMVDGEAIKLLVPCNDLFFWACADAEDFDVAELEAFRKTLSECDHGELLWCCHKREMRPQNPYYKYFTPEEVELFNDAGPERKEPGCQS